MDWLLAEFTALAADANRAGASIQIAKQEGHRFKIGASTMVGRLITFTNGVRTLYVEAGWPRVPRDGVVRGGGLACAHIRHLGIRNAGEELLLTKSQNGAPVWKSLKYVSLHQTHIRRHIAILLDQHR